MFYHLLLLSFLLFGAIAFNCQPCAEVDCSMFPVDLTDCDYGMVKESCLCCDVCGGGPGEVCSIEYGMCGAGLECVKNISTNISEIRKESISGKCVFIGNGMSVHYFNVLTELEINHI